MTWALTHPVVQAEEPRLHLPPSLAEGEGLNMSSASPGAGMEWAGGDQQWIL